MEIGINSFVEQTPDPTTGVTVSADDRVRDLLEEIELADQVGLDVVGIGEHHRQDYVASAPVVLLAAAAARTKRIRLTSAVTVLSSDDPVRVFQEFATLDLISHGRAEIIVGRGSFTESYPLFGYDLHDYDSLFAEKLDLLLELRKNVNVHWSGKHRAALTGQAVYPRPLQEALPVWVGVGGTPQSFIRAGKLGLPLTVGIIGGEPHHFKPLIDSYRGAGHRAGFSKEDLQVAVGTLGFVSDSARQAADDFYISYSSMVNKIGRERGWGPFSRTQFDAICTPRGALLVGEPEAVAEKILYENEVLGGISRITVQFTPATMPHAKVMRAIELLGTRVAPIVRRELTVKSSSELLPTGPHSVHA